MKDIRLTIKASNARLHKAAEAVGCRTAAELSRASGISYNQIGELLTMRKAARTPGGGWSKPALRLAEFLGVSVETLFSERQQYKNLKVRAVVVDVAEDEISRLIDTSAAQTPLDALQDKDTARVLRDAIGALPPRISRVLTARFYEDKPYYEIGKELFVSPERARQLELKGVRYLKHRARHNPELKALSFLGASNVEEP